VTDLRILEERLGHHFHHAGLLERALVHGDAYGGPPGNRARSNERLSILGDAVVDLLATERVLEEHPGAGVGDITERRKPLVNNTSLAAAAERFGVWGYLTKVQTGTQGRETILSTAMEAIVAAAYLDGGLAAARAVFSRCALLPAPTRQRPPEPKPSPPEPKRAAVAPGAVPGRRRGRGRRGRRGGRPDTAPGPGWTGKGARGLGAGGGTPPRRGRSLGPGPET
jgi:ribonuclease-3